MFSREKEILTKDEWNLVKEQLPEKFRLLFGVLHGSGLRISELLRLRVRDVTLSGKNKGKIKVRKAKVGQSRDAMMDKILADRVHKYVQKEKLQPNTIIFTN